MQKTIYRSHQGMAIVQGWCKDQLDAWQIPHEERIIIANGLETHLVVAGSGPTTVVFVAGDRFNSAACLPLLTAISSKYRVIAADVPGQPGLSSGNANEMNGKLSWYGSWIDQVVEQVATEAVIVGHSFGGAVVLASKSPHIQARIAIAPGGLCGLRLTPSILRAFIRWTLFPTTKSSYRVLKQLHAPVNEPRKELVEWMTLVAKHSRPVSSSELLHAISTVSKGTMVATGEYDVFLPPDRLAPATQRLLNSPVQTILHAGHMEVDEQPERVVELITKVIS
jgi:pimeloyl-ACP methyl ester carboxylesterase